MWTKKFRNIFFTGLPASGKTTFGKLYAFHSKRTFVDLDDWIERRVKMSVADFFQKEGEEAFRDVESKLFMRFERSQNCVISLGGGSLEPEHHLRLTRKWGFIVYLKSNDLNVVAHRIWNDKNKRPLFSKAQDIQEIHDILKNLEAKRSPVYEQADLHLLTDYSSYDALKLQLELIERRASMKSYLSDVSQILDI